MREGAIDSAILFVRHALLMSPETGLAGESPHRAAASAARSRRAMVCSKPAFIEPFSLARFDAGER
jgi:hypothetical protein